MIESLSPRRILTAALGAVLFAALAVAALHVAPAESAGIAGAGARGPRTSLTTCDTSNALGDPDADGIASGYEVSLGTDPCTFDTDSDGCMDGNEISLDPAFGGDRRPLANDFYDADGNDRIDLADALIILSNFGASPGSPQSLAVDRYAPDAARPWRVAQASDGLDLTDVLVNLESFGHDCTKSVLIPECPDGMIGVKFESPFNAGTIGPITVTNVVFIDGEPKYFDWTSTVGIDFVYVKASTTYTTYAYNPEAFSGTALSGPQGPDGPRGISHVLFCYDDDGSPTPTSTPAGGTATFTATPTNTPIGTPTWTSTPAGGTATFTATPTNTPIGTPTRTNTPTGGTATFTATPTQTNTPTGGTATFTATPTRTNTPTGGTATFTATPTRTNTPTGGTATFTTTPTRTNTPTGGTVTFTATPTRTNTPTSGTATFTATPTRTNTPTSVPCTPTAEPTPGRNGLVKSIDCQLPSGDTLLWNLWLCDDQSNDAIDNNGDSTVDDEPPTCRRNGEGSLRIDELIYALEDCDTRNDDDDGDGKPVSNDPDSPGYRPECPAPTLTDYAQDLVDKDGGELPEGLGAFEFQLKFDHKIFDIQIVSSQDWSNGRTIDCSITVITENDIRYGCVTSGPGLGIPRPQGVVGAQIIVYPEPDLRYRIRASKDNGVVRRILDENCEIADIYGDIFPGTNAGLTPDCTDVDITVRRLEGDLDMDCDVDLYDQQLMNFHYQAFFGSLLYDPAFDLEPWPTGDFDIDVKDVQFVNGRVGSTCEHPIPDNQWPVPAYIVALP